MLDRAIRIYDTANGNFKKFKKIMARDVGWSILDTAFSPDGKVNLKCTIKIKWFNRG